MVDTLSLCLGVLVLLIVIRMRGVALTLVGGMRLPGRRHGLQSRLPNRHGHSNYLNHGPATRRATTSGNKGVRS
jgi:hypothetical protein